MSHSQNRRAALAMLGAAPLGVALGAGLAGSARAQTLMPSSEPRTRAAPVEPEAGAWRPWLLQSGSQIRLPAPPDSSAEIGAVQAMAAQRNAATLDRIAYWDAGPAPYR